MVRAAATAGADAAKFQRRDNAHLYSPALLAAPYVGPNSYGATYGEHRAALEIALPVYRYLLERGAAAGIHVFATAFDERSADDLCEVGVPALKLASGSLTDLALLTHVRSLGKPIILSTGGGTMEDIDRAVATLYGHVPLALLHCTAEYPVKDPAHLNLNVIWKLRERFRSLVIGWSAHDVSPNASGITNALVAYGLGANIFEFHFTLDHTQKGTDHAFSLEPAGLKKLCDDLKRAYVARGDGIKVFYEEERKPIAKMRRTEKDGVWQIR
jgi:N-acetylneuraminate synthase/sialic acid synthase